jgi:ribosomal protein S18 acetylase RimI-like enzyme
MAEFELVTIDPTAWESLLQVAELDREAFGEDGLTAGNLVLLARTGRILALAGPDGRLVAESLVLSRMPGLATPPDAATAFLFSLAVAGHCRRQGLAARLLQAVLDQARADGFSHLELTVDPDNTAAQRLYLDRFGFRLDRRLPDLLGPGRHRLLLSLELGQGSR